MSQAAARSRRDMMSPVPSGPVSMRHARSAEWRTRRTRHKMRPVRVMEESVGELLTLTVQDPSDLQGAIVYDCRPPLLPVSLRLENIASASLVAPPQEDCMAIGGVSPERVAIPELGVAPLVDPDNELPTPEDSMLLNDSSPEGVRLPGGCPAPPDIADLELEKALLYVSALPVMVTPMVVPVVFFSGGSVFVSGASSSCSAGRRSSCYVADFSTPGGSRQPSPGCVPVVPDLARLLRL